MKKNTVFVLGMLVTVLTFGVFTAQPVSAQDYKVQTAAERDEYFLDREWHAEDYYVVVRSDDIPNNTAAITTIWEGGPLTGYKVVDGAIYIYDGKNWKLSAIFMTKARTVKGVEIYWHGTKEKAAEFKDAVAGQKITVWGPFGGPATDAVIKQRHQKILDNIQAYINNPNSPPTNWQ